MKRIIISFGWLVAAGVTIAGTGASNEFRLDCRTGVRTAAATEKIQYSTAWATNLTAAQQGEAKAVVKVNPCLKTPPKYLVVDMSGGRSAARWPVSYLNEVPSGGWTDEYKTEKLVLRYIPAGSFIMGGRATDYPGAVNTNLHMVTLTKPFYIGVFECTQRQWELAMGNRPSQFANESCYKMRPVEHLSYGEIRGLSNYKQFPGDNTIGSGSFMKLLQAKTRLLFDLPTEAQWEYACRAATTTALNSGKNITADTRCANLDEVGRYGYNSGYYPDGCPDDSDVTRGTAVAGSYRPNVFGIYDMHGNVWEWCLDWYDPDYRGAIDPLGSEVGVRRSLRGGSFRTPGIGDSMCSSGWRGNENPTLIDRAIGFRICLHDATVYPSADSATVLVDASGAAAADWMPTRAGTYQLTHEVQVDGVTVAPMESALFRVDGPELEIVPMGELTNGVMVKVEKVGGGGEWAVYYSLDGSEPTAGSTVYEGPFALPASATVKAVAISAGGVSSEVASKELVLSPALAVEDVAARQRYPWNGKVDIDCEVKGDAAKKYAVTFVVEDEVGHTNLPIRTVGADVLGGPQPQNNENALDGGSGVPGGHALPFVLSPGKYRFVWDAAADLPKGTRFGGVSVSIDAVPSPLADWKRVVEITVDGYAGSETLTDVPVLVRLSAAIDGFDYADFAAPDTGADMIFTDMEGTARYTYEIDEWHADGESLVWVKLPELRKGTKFLLAYGKAETGNSEQVIVNSEDQKHEVWRDYAGVWHMNEDSGTAYDSTAHGLDALPESSGSTIDEMVSNALGACGKSRYNAKTANDNRMRIPSYDALTLGSHFVASGWFRVESISGWPKLFFRNIAEWSGGGWGVETSKNDPTQLTVVGASSGSSPYMKNVAIPDLRDNWVCLTFVYDGTMVSAYANGEFSKSGEILPAGDNGAPLYVGSVSSGGESCYVGQYDEIRLRGGTLSADRIKADYDMIANRDFCTYGKVEAGPGAEPVPPTRVVTITFDPNGGELAGAATRVYKGNRVMFGELPEPTRTGYAFGGWSLTQDGTAKITSSDFVPDMDKVVFATWTAATYSVKFNANGGTGTMADESFTYGTAKALTANAFTRTGYTFDGWATSADGAKVYSDKEVVSNLETTQGAIVNLYAVWKGALYMVVDLSGGASAESYPVSYLNAVPSGGWSDTYKTTKLVLRRCDPGTFMMQGKKSVTLTKTFYIAIYEMTVGQDKKIAGRSYTDYHDADALTEWDRYADSLISYNTIRGASKGGQWPSSDAVDSSSIIGKLRSKTSLKFDLPTEAQWEYACRAGKTTLYNDGSSDGVGLGYFESRYGSPTIVGKYKANAWGIYDMHGNVLEHVLDWYGDIATTSAQDPLGPGTGTNRSCRGGSFRDCKAGVYGGQVNNTPISESGSKVCTSNSRVGIAPDLGCAHSPDYTSNCPELGFRVVVNQ